jgi:hypothetical protein
MDRLICRIAALATLLAMLAFTPASAAERQTSPTLDMNADGASSASGRPYADGPLTAADLAGKPPERSPVNLGIEMVARTECQVQYDYRFTGAKTGSDEWTVRLSRFTCKAVLVPEKCWNTMPGSPRVLDHEQGHFDLAEIFARRTQQHFDRLMADRKAKATGMDSRSARKALENDIKKAMAEVYESLNKAQKTYDEETRHGTSRRAQAAHREWQRAELNKLAEK